MIRADVHGIRPRPFSVDETRDIVPELIKIQVGRNELIGDRDLTFTRSQGAGKHDRLIGPRTCRNSGTGRPLTGECGIDENVCLLITDRGAGSVLEKSRVSVPERSFGSKSSRR
jgi:hypothetical protein